jgi:hypothetical protein
MGANASRVKALFDVADAVTLRDITDGAETATATELGVSLNELDAAYWQGGEQPNGILRVVFNITEAATDGAGTAETYVLSLLVDDVAAMNDTPTTVWSQAIATGFTGVLYAYVDARNIQVLDTESSGSDKFIASRITITGDDPSFTYGAWLDKSIKS